MKRRNFLYRLLTRFFMRKPVQLCGEPIGTAVLIREAKPKSQVETILALQKGQSLLDPCTPGRWHPRIDGLTPVVRCSLPVGHKGPHVLLNPS